MRDFYPNGFVPMSSGPALQAQPRLMEEFLMRTSPRVFANQVKVDPTGKGFTDNARLTQVLRVTFPVASPVALLLQGTVADSARFPRPSALSAVTINKGNPMAPLEGVGRFVVEWGSGEARGYLFTDFADGSLQLPSAIEVSVFAYVESGVSQYASAVAMPDAVLANPRATFTTDVVATSEVEVALDRRPFSRALTASFAATGVRDASVPIQLDVYARRKDSVVGHWAIPDPANVGMVAAPGPLVGVPFGGGVDHFRARFSGLPSAPDDDDDNPDVGALVGAASLVETIQV